MRKTVQVFLLLFIFSLVIHSISALVIPLSRFIWSVDIGDIDQNGQKDIIVGHYVPFGSIAPSFTILYNYAVHGFTSIDSSFVFGESQDCIQLANMNNDNFPDIVCRYSINGNTTQYARIYYNQNGSFSPFVDYLFTGDSYYNEIRTGDVNGDGLGDIIFYSYAWYYLWVLVSDGPNNFSPLYQCSLDFPPQDIAIGDVDNDGRDEIVFAGQPLTIFDYTINGWQQITLNSMAFHSMVRLGDVDDDGTNEIFTLEIPPAGNEFPFRIYKLINGQIEQMYQYIYTDAGWLEVFDYNNDNLADYKLGRRLFTNLGNYNFNEMSLTFPSFPSNDIHIDDVNSDGFLDLVFSCANDSSGFLNILFGDGRGHFSVDPVIAIDENVLPSLSIVTLSNYPNPFTTSTSLVVSGDPNKRSGRISILNLKGQIIRQIGYDSYKKDFFWDGSDDNKKPVSNGVYICKYTNNKGVYSAIKIVKIK
ncbi:MAG TPA: FG-GAP-like repeat-containing protein [Candidatus Cloacimonadota bacterium]|nr:FG-GAP-like repeat-containing protein [Candidatus Cloacimonadota bacterium]HQL15078.1 FG-GAP-like repeat-containing protein [Candidatus Cloacimonadota bacterium]